MSNGIQRLVDLTESQKKAWNKIEKAFKEFKSAGGKVYTVLGTVSAYNGQYIAGVDNDVGHHTADVFMPSISDEGLSGFADDWHGFILKEGVEVSSDE